MKALVCNEFGPIENLKYQDLPDPEPGEGQVVIEVKAASVNFPDVLVVQNLYQFKPEPPFAPGNEVAGPVLKVGPGVTGVKVGDRVFSSGPFGGFAEQYLANVNDVVPLSSDMPYDEAASFMMVYGTSHHALKQRADLRPGETLLVLGASGGVGLAAVELGKAMGARVIAAASSQEKVDFCLANGADDGFVYERNPLDRDQQKALSNQIKEITGGKGADVIYDPVGDDYAEPALRAIAWKGRYLVVGFAAGAIPKVPLNLALLKGCQIVGVFWGMFKGVENALHNENMDELMKWYQEGKVRPRISKSYPLEDALQALRDMADRKVKGKVVITP
jgi:NADPH:quinone reductase